MGTEIEVIDNTDEILLLFTMAVNRALEHCGMEGERAAKDLCPYDEGALKNSITHRVVDSNFGQVAIIGTNNEYAAYVELGTGQYYSGGRKTPWVYQDEKGDWHMTHGQKAKPYLKPAVTDNASTFRKIIKDELRNG